MTTVIPFSSTFTTKYSTALHELLRLGSLASQKKISGKESLVEDDRAQRMLMVLLALSKPGLSSDQIESLEYCLRNLNETLVKPTLFGPTVQSLFPFTLVPKRLSAYPHASYLLSGSNVNLVYSPRQRVTLSMAPGSFTVTGENATLTPVIHNHYTLSMSPGSFALTGIDSTLTLSIQSETLEAYLETEAFGAQHFLCDFYNGFDPHKQITVVGNGGFGTRPIHYGATMLVTVKKTTNGGIAQDVGHVIFSKNGINEAGTGSIGSGNGTQNFVLGDNLGTGSIQYGFTGLVADDLLRVTITEG